MTEKRFGAQIINNLDNINKQEFHLDRYNLRDMKKKVVADSKDYGDLRANLVSDNRDTYIVDSMIIKGVSPRRDENDCNYDYVLEKGKDHMGMRFYMHKYFTGHMHYYLHVKYQQQVKRLVELQEIVEK